METIFQVTPGKLKLSTIHHLLSNPCKLSLPENAWAEMATSQAGLETMLASGKPIYGVNTGFGLMAHTTIKAEDRETLQHHLILSHAAGTGALLSEPMVKIILLLKINSLARGFSGVRPEVLEHLLAWYQHEIYPCIPCKGSVGASGDLAPLAHLSLPLLGEGQAWFRGKIISGQEVLNLIARPAITLAAKEGLALLNGTQFSTGLALYQLLHAQDLLNLSLVIGALSVEAAAGSITPFHPLIHEVRGQVGQKLVAKKMRALLKHRRLKSSLSTVQDPYSLRCQPQVLGACLDNLKHIANILEIEANAVSDNPLVFAKQSLVLSGGNFHAEPVAQAADLLAIVLAEIGALAERRLALLIDPHFNKGLPAFLTPNPGLNSGFMSAQTTAASLASANKSLAHPASVDSIPTSANQEDHVSMAAFAAWRLSDIIDNVRDILAIELMAACQGVALRGLAISPALEAVMSLTRSVIPFWDKDRLFADDLVKARGVLEQLALSQEPLLFRKRCAHVPGP